MKVKVISVVIPVLLLSACATTTPIQNPSGQSVKFVSPILGKSGMAGARYVLLEKSIADGKYKVVGQPSKMRQPITNERQERIAFNADLTGYAPDYTDYSFETYVDSGNYGQKTATMTCVEFPLKTQKYGPCTSEFGDVFTPFGVVKEYNAGRLNQRSWKEWTDPALNRMRYVKSPQYALMQAGVFARMSELANAN